MRMIRTRDQNCLTCRNLQIFINIAWKEKTKQESFKLRQTRKQVPDFVNVFNILERKEIVKFTFALLCLVHYINILRLDGFVLPFNYFYFGKEFITEIPNLMSIQKSAPFFGSSDCVAVPGLVQNAVYLSLNM